MIEEGLPGRMRGVAMATMMLASFMATLDTAVANVALPTIGASLQASASASIWVVNAYQIAMVAVLLPVAALGGIVGHRRVYAVGLAIFTVASLLCGFSWSLPCLLVGRVLQGLGAAGIIGTANALIRLIYPIGQMGRAQGVNALTVAVSFAVGPTVAAAVLAVATWPWLFLINVPLGITVFGLSFRTLPDNGADQSAHRFDITAAVLLSGMVALLMLALGDAAHGTGSGLVLGLGGTALACCLILLRRQRSHSAPLLPVDLLGNLNFSLSLVVSVLSYAAQGLAFVSLPFLFERSLGKTAVESGFLLTPWPVVVAVVSPIAGYLSERRSVALLGGGGLAILCAGLVALALLPDRASHLDIGWRLALCGAGFGLFQSPNLKALAAGAPRERSSAASGLIPTARLIGQAIGAALVATCFTYCGQGGPVAALWLGGALAATASVTSLSRLLAVGAGC